MISAGKMSGLWSGTPASVKLSDLDVICAVLGCGVEELLIAEPGKLAQPAGDQPGKQAAAPSQAVPPVTPRRRDGRSLPARLRPPASRRRPGRQLPGLPVLGILLRRQSYCRACYDFTRRYHPGECASCRRILAVKKGHCRLCWLQAGLRYRARITPGPTFSQAGYRQLSLAGMGSAAPAPPPPPRSRQPASAAVRPAPPGHSCSCRSRRVPALRQEPLGASAITGQALPRARRIAAGLAATRGWNPRIVTETGRALAVVLADHIPRGDRLVQLSPRLHSRDLSVTRTAEILGLAGLLHDNRIPLLPPPSAGTARAAARRRWPPTSGRWLRTRIQGGPAAVPATSTPSG